MRRGLVGCLICCLLLAAKATIAAGRYVAVIVGISHYEHGYALLDYAGRDAGRVANSLRAMGYGVKELSADAQVGSVERDDVVKALRTALASLQPEDTFLFYFAGHGSRRNGEDYLLFSDTDPDHFETTALSLETLGEMLKSCPVRKRIFVVDACRAGSRADGQTGFAGGSLDKGFKERLDNVVHQAPQNVAVEAGVLYACSPGETSRESSEGEGGVFTLGLVAALDRHVARLDELAQSIAASLPVSLQGKQHPVVQGNSMIAILPPSPALPWLQAAYVAYDKQDYQEAEADYRKAIDADPKYADAYYGLGRVYYLIEKDYDQAEVNYRKAIELDPKNTYAYNGLGNIYNEVKKNYEQAETYYRKAIELDPKFANAYHGLGTVYYNKQNYEQAEANFRKSIELDPKFASAYASLGDVYHNIKKDYNQAETWYRKAIDTDPKYALAYANLAGTLYMQGRRDDAKEQAQKAKDLGLAQHPVYALLGL